jgi:hypothetical protein
MYARGAYAPKQERERIQRLVRDARPSSVPSEPSDYNSPPFRLAARRRDAAPSEDEGAPIQQSLF